MPGLVVGSIIFLGGFYFFAEWTDEIQRLGLERRVRGDLDPGVSFLGVFVLIITFFWIGWLLPLLPIYLRALVSLEGLDDFQNQSRSKVSKLS